MKKPGVKRKTPLREKTHDDIKLTNVPTKITEQLDNIASHLGINRGQMLKSKLPEIVNSYPEHMRLKRLGGE